MVGREEVLRAIGDGAVCTLNALSPEQHTGAGGNSYGRPGRIKGSVNLPAMHLTDPVTNAFLPAPELRRRFEAVGAFARRSSLTAAAGSPRAPMRSLSSCSVTLASSFTTRR